MLMKRVKLFMACLFLSLTAAFAQGQQVSGIVTDAANGEPLIGAAVMVKGTRTGASAGNDGSYSVRVANPQEAVLVFSFYGYKTVEIPVAGQSRVNAEMEMDATVLDDVIVVAYGTVRREAATGSVSAVKGEQLATAPATSVDKMLQGKMAGVQMASYSGQPGSTTAIRIRGTSSINAGNEPLWVVDGIPIIADDNRALSNYGVGGGTNTAFLNPNDIESITVLKDAAAASVYGSRAANGVILVTTKSGKSGEAKFTARAKYGVQQLANDNHFLPMTGPELVGYWRDALKFAGYDPDANGVTEEALLKDGYHDWYKDLTKLGSLQEYEINATGGTDRAKYYSSLAYHKNEGVYNGLDYSRFSARLNAEYKLTKSITSGAKINLAYNNSNSGPMGSSYYINPAQAMYNLLPWTPIYDKDGAFHQPAENSKLNPLANALYDENNDKEYRVNASMFLEWKPLRQLTFKTTNGAEASFIDSRNYNNPLADPDGESSLYTYRIKEIRYTTSNTATYQDKFDDHSLRLLAGQEAMLNTYDYVGVESPDVDPAIPYITTSTAAKDHGLFNYTQYSLLSFFGVADYNYANKYFLSASVRGDGSSLFGSAHRWGLFWSVSGSWNISNERFMKPTSEWLSQLKVRASYGVNGNNNISAYRAYGVYGTNSYNGMNGMAPSRPDNPNLSWEKNKTWNVGLDFGFWDDRITGSIDAYSRLTTDMLLNKSVPYTTGFGSNFMNTGSMRNRGLEFMVDATLVRNSDWFWSVGGNLAFNRTKVLDLAGSGFLTAADPRNDEEMAVRIVEGMNLYNFYIRDYAGVNPSNGYGLFWTEDHKLTSDRTKARYYYAGSPEPKFTGGFNTNVSWKGLSLSAYFDFTYGNKVMTNNWFITDGADALNKNSQNTALNYWKKPGDTGVNPVPLAGSSNVWYAGYSTRFLEDGSYLRIKDVTLSYALPQNILDVIRMQGVKLYVSALNAYTFHHVNALDPEFGPLGCAYGGNHTMVKTFVGGIEVTF